MTLMDGFVRAGSRTDGSPLTAAACWREAIHYYVEKERMGELQPTESWYPADIFFLAMKFKFLGDSTLEYKIKSKLNQNMDSKIHDLT
jgi:hypothetical protein